MRKNVKQVTILLLIALLITIAIGCGSDKKTEITAPSSVTTEEKNKESKATEAIAKNEEKEEPKASGKASDTETVETKTPVKSSITIEEAVLLDQDGIKITIKSIDMKGLFGPELKMLFENNREESVTIQARNTSVNGYMIDPMMSVDVVAGKKANDSMTLSSTDLNLAGIETIADIEFSFHVFNSDTWDELFDSNLIRIETSASKDYQYTFDNSGHQVYHDNGVEIVVKGLAKEDSWLGKEVIVYIFNESDRNVTIQVRDVSVNGFMMEPIFSCDVFAGKHAVDTITFMSSNLEENDIKEIENIELSFHIFDEDSWDTIADSPVITINFN